MSASEAKQGFITKYATAATIGLSVVVGATGLMLLFHLGESSVKGIHEWLGVAFVVASVLHVVRNGQAFCRLMARARTLIVCAVVLGGAGAMVAAETAAHADGTGGNPVVAMAELLSKAPLEQVAGLNREPVSAMIARLGSAGIKGADGAKSLTEIAAENGTDVRRLLGTVLAKTAPDAGSVSADTGSQSGRSGAGGS